MEITNSTTANVFVAEIKRIINELEPDVEKQTQLRSLATQILSLLDNGLNDLPPFMVIPLPDPAETTRLQEGGLDWYPTLNDDQGMDLDIGGALETKLRALLYFEGDNLTTK